MRIKSLLVLCSLLSSGIASIAQVTIGGEFRPRSEYSHGYGTLANAGQDASFFTAQRTRINLGLKSDVVQSKIVLQDVRLWGSQAQLVSNEDFAVSIHEAWAETSLPGNWSLKAGRQELVYDDSRILGNVGWAQQGRSHDLAILKFNSVVDVHFGMASYQNSNRANNIYDGANAYKAMQFLWVHKKLEKFSVSVLALNNGVAFTTGDTQETEYSQTVGTHVKYKASDKINFAFNAYYQGGSVVYKNAIRSLAAYNFLAEANYMQGNIKWTLGYELLSGNDASDNSTLQSFTPLYGTNHKFNGFMDYFYVGNHMHSVGLHDAYIKGAYAKDKNSLLLHVHLFSAASSAGSVKAGMLGTEIDCSFGYALSKTTKLSVGYSHLIATENMQALKGGVANQMHNWAYFMFSFKL